MHLTLKTRVLLIFLESLSAQCSLHGEFGPKPNVEQDGVANITPTVLGRATVQGSWHTRPIKPTVTVFNYRLLHFDLRLKLLQHPHCGHVKQFLVPISPNRKAS